MYKALIAEMAEVIGQEAAKDTASKIERGARIDGIIAARYGAFVGRRDASLECSDWALSNGKPDLETYRDYLVYERICRELERAFDIRFQ